MSPIGSAAHTLQSKLEENLWKKQLLTSKVLIGKHWRCQDTFWQFPGQALDLTPAHTCHGTSWTSARDCGTWWPDLELSRNRLVRFNISCIGDSNLQPSCLPHFKIKSKTPQVTQFKNSRGLPGCGRADRLLFVGGSFLHLWQKLPAPRTVPESPPTSRTPS